MVLNPLLPVASDQQIRERSANRLPGVGFVVSVRGHRVHLKAHEVSGRAPAQVDPGQGQLQLLGQRGTALGDLGRQIRHVQAGLRAHARSVAIVGGVASDLGRERELAHDVDPYIHARDVLLELGRERVEAT